MQAKYRHSLPQLNSSNLLLTEGGIETTLVYKKGFHLPEFASGPLLLTPEGTKALQDCHASYIDIALRHKRGIIVETQTWRSSRIWCDKLGFSENEMMKLNRRAVAFLEDVRREYETDTTPIVVSGNLGPLSDAYHNSTQRLSVQDMIAVYRDQVQALCEAGVDMLSIMTLADTTEAIAAVQLAKEFGIQILVSFSVETDGKLLNGVTLEDAIRTVDKATESYAAYFGINCAHPSHFHPTLRMMDPSVLSRIGEIRANASRRSHQELDNSEFLDRGDPTDLGRSFKDLIQLLPGLKVVGGCCGTDPEHVEAIASNVC
ncbi:uncharacterized protein Z518_04730 [Rhinocladiella mackenziei CBS 650.93]|uniref:Hcy-binding domain-containing protein n=1 Tax=Rhinocladiella mackenziei CBS 650.93 TaxID=1442369 RepID=A0A0D2ILW0_9EURO|nr:uncharacterized protein Z518_04730 [Rhinocladiella mackenziei CBS 650.93]KIX06754.1 hypothetical protein Z518_04730 [Rhinocladiella mackenziei CBS 650.93]